MEPAGYPDNDPGPYTLLAAGHARRHHGQDGLAAGPRHRLFRRDQLSGRPVRGLGHRHERLPRRSCASAAWPSSTTARRAAGPAPGPAPAPTASSTRPRPPPPSSASLNALEAVAKARGAALGTGFGYPVTVEAAARWTAGLEPRPAAGPGVVDDAAAGTVGRVASGSEPVARSSPPRHAASASRCCTMPTRHDHSCRSLPLPPQRRRRAVPSPTAGSGWAGAPTRPAPHNWQFPQGGVDDGRGPRGRRPARTGGGDRRGLRRAARPHRRLDRLRLSRRAHSGIARSPSGWKGQSQVWFALRFTGEDSEIDLTASTARRVRRLALGRLSTKRRDLIVPFKREAYEQVVAGVSR